MKKITNMRKIGICTVFTGYNYGSALQALATKKIVAGFGYDPIIIKPTSFFSRNRDIRVSKLLCIFFRSLIHKRLMQEFKKYYSSIHISINKEKKNSFTFYYENFLNPYSCTYLEIKKKAKTNDYFAFLCGSDQIWNSESLYLNPFYFLSFSPVFKRIAFAPSFGRDYIPKYNINKIGGKISKIPYISCREDSGVNLLKDLYNINAELIMDPTLILKREDWIKILPDQNNNKKNIVTYFLNKPNEHIAKFIENYAKANNIAVINVSNIEDLGFPSTYISNCGPIEFIKFVNESSTIFTDSFHGTVFSLIFNKPFYVFERNYSQGAGNQSTRIISLLQKVQLLERFNNFDAACHTIDFNKVNYILEKERNKALKYLEKCFKEINDYEK